MPNVLQSLIYFISLNVYQQSVVFMHLLVDQDTKIEQEMDSELAIFLFDTFTMNFHIYSCNHGHIHCSYKTTDNTTT